MVDAQQQEFVLAIDIGGGSVKLALADASGAEIGSRAIDDVPGFDRDGLLDAIGQQAQALIALGQARGGRVGGIAIGVPGFLSPDRRASMNSNVPALDGYDLVRHFGGRFACSVEVENDANLAALGEWSFGPWHAAQRFMMVTLGTGIGVALLDGGKPIGVVGGTLGDAGHVIVEPSGEHVCRLGCHGCLEAVASGVALLEAAAGLAEQIPDSALGEARRRGILNGGEIARLAAAGDAMTLAMLGDIGRWIGLGLASYNNAFAPGVIAIGGGMSRYRPYIEASMLAAVAEGRIKNRPGPEAIYFSSDYDRAAARGAATIFFGERSGTHG